MEKGNLSTLLNKLEAYWLESKAPILNKLNPGFPEIKVPIPNFTGILPEQVRELYHWKNGVKPVAGDTIGHLTFFRLGIFPSFEQARQIQRQKAGSENGWNPSKLVLFESGGGDYFLIEGNNNSASYAQIFFHSIISPEFNREIAIYDSLYSLFLTMYECFVNEIYSYSNGQFDSGDTMEEIKMAASLNPKSDYWRLGG